MTPQRERQPETKRKRERHLLKPFGKPERAERLRLAGLDGADVAAHDCVRCAAERVLHNGMVDQRQQGQIGFTRSISPHHASAERKNKIMIGDAAQTKRRALHCRGQKHVLYGTCNSLVSLLSRYGTCALPPDVSALMTLPRALRLLLI